jgi:ABC-type lipoprotein release transport system permease subunit
MWRSRRRTVITVSSIFFAVIFAIMMRVIAVGVFDKMINDTVSLSSGYIQIHHKGYWDNKTVDSSFEQSPRLTNILNTTPGISAWAPRLESFALASSGDHTKGILVTGIEPAKENAVSHLSQKIIAGAYINDTDNCIMLAEGLAKYLRLKLNDTAVLLGYGYQGNMAAGKYKIKAIVRLGMPEMDKAMAWLPVKASRLLLGTGARYTSVSLLTDDRNKLDAIKQSIVQQTAGDDYEVMLWQEMIPELDQFFRAKMGQNAIISGILYMVIAFGIFGTILMMLNERMHEFGILIAIGMKKVKLSFIVVLEMIFMSVVAVILGVLVAYPIVYYFKLHPIMMGGDFAKTMQRFNIQPVIVPATNASHFIMQGYIVLIITIALSMFAVYRVNKIKVIQAINS